MKTAVAKKETIKIISVSVGDEKTIFLDELEESARQAKAHIKGEIKLKSAWDVLDEL